MTLTKPIAAYHERYTVLSAEALHRDIGRVLSTADMRALEYEERNLHIHFPTRLCPRCGEVIRMQVAVDSYRERRTRCCPDCGLLDADEHTDAELTQIFLDAGVWGPNL